MNESAIRHLAGILLEKVPAEIWDFRVIWSAPDMAREDALEALATLSPGCGAVGCAGGIARAAFPQIRDDPDHVWDSVCEVLGMRRDHYDRIFGTWGCDSVYDKRSHEVTPQDVGRALLRYIDEGPWWKS